jgi:hypothetical protein
MSETHGEDYPDDDRDHHASIAVYLILTLITLGIFNLYWNYRQMQACNSMLERREFRFWVWILLCIVTIGLYHFYYQYKMGSAIVEIQARREEVVTDWLPVASVVAAILGAGVAADCLHQHEINKLVY